MQQEELEMNYHIIHNNLADENNCLTSLNSKWTKQNTKRSIEIEL